MSFLSRSVKAGSRAASMVQARTFSSTPAARDIARVSLIGRLTRDPEVRKTKSDSDYITYDIAVSQGLTAPDENGRKWVVMQRFIFVPRADLLKSHYWNHRTTAAPGQLLQDLVFPRELYPFTPELD
ncbi:hypothetical protein QFC22_005755 [Naganishia vaughanmartiniae]|uniref:Uncharacterized protein n=1 Tax=Naganishia vaughanmartiniae TaxID=1424756 RepID=A0ACC2WS86_9TREE|nr:hypothetical protein QFC22_005755 [Naganishia vaughanmartiniae]